MRRKLLTPDWGITLLWFDPPVSSQHDSLYSNLTPIEVNTVSNEQARQFVKHAITYCRDERYAHFTDNYLYDAYMGAILLLGDIQCRIFRQVD